VFVECVAFLYLQYHFYYAVQVSLVPVTFKGRSEGSVKFSHRDSVVVVDLGVGMDNVERESIFGD
jgi:hypothetical protein